jgi:hypothetical protein
MNHYFDGNNKNIMQGMLILILGILLLLYTIGLIETAINTILILASICLISYGTITTGLGDFIRKLLNR